ncbi:MAG: glycosyltransferase [Chloroflexota bacterium]
MRRVCILPGHLRMTGAVRVMLNLARSLVERGVEVDLFLTKDPGDLAPMIPRGVHLIVGGGSSFRSLPALARYIRRRRPDAVLAAHQADNIVGVVASALARVPSRVVATVHNDRSIRPGVSRLRLLAMTTAMKLAYRRAYAVVAVSDGVANNTAQVLGLPRERIRVIYNPTITTQLLDAAARPVDHPWLATPDVPVILGVGRLTEQKDFASLIRSFAIVRQTMPARLMILGEGEDRLSLEELTRELMVDADVALPGTTPNALAYMKRAAVLVATSRWEGFPGVLVEALAVGTPVVATDCPSGPREILDGGRYGRLVPVGDIEAIAAAVLATLRDSPQRDPLIARGRSFSAERAVDEYLALLTPATAVGAAG